MMNLQRNPDYLGQDISTLPDVRTSLPSAVQRVVATIWMWMERTRQRGALAELDDRLLKDVGITRSEASHEIAKPFWR